MSLTVTAIQPVPAPAPANQHSNAPMAALMAAMLLGAFAAQRSKKQMRRFQLKMGVALAKFKLQSAWRRLFNRAEPHISTTTLLYILLAILVLILLLLLPPIVAIIVLLVGIILLLLTRR